eukprot:182704_1
MFLTFFLFKNHLIVCYIMSNFTWCALSILFMCTYSTSIDAPSMVSEWLESIQLNVLSSPIPLEPVSVIKTQSSHSYLYYGLHNGDVAIANLNDADQALSYIPVPNEFEHHSIIDLIPIYQSMMAVLLQSNGTYHCLFIGLNYTSSSVQSNGIHHRISLTNPVAMHFNSRTKELLFVHYNSVEITHLTLYKIRDDAPYLSTPNDIELHTEINIDPEDALYITEMDPDSYIISANTGCNTAYIIDRQYTVHPLHFTVHSWASVPSALQSLSLYSPVMGYVSSSCFIDVLNPIDNVNSTVRSMAQPWIHTILKQHDIKMDWVEAASMIQRGMDLGALMVIDNHDQHHKQLVYVGGLSAISHEPDNAIHGSQRRLLMEMPLLDARYLRYQEKKRGSRYYPPALQTPPRRDALKSHVPKVVQDARAAVVPPRRSRTPAARQTPRGSRSYPLDPLLCWKRKLQAATDCYINNIRYHVIKKLGAGADGDVFLAKQYSRTDRIKDVALKQFSREKSFQREAKMLLLLKDSPYSTHALDLSPETDDRGSKPSTFIIVMEFVAGGDLKHFMVQTHESAKASLPIAILRRYLLDLSHPLSILNSNLNVMHTDIKPDNILVAVGFDYPDDEPNIDFILADMSVSLSYDQFTAGSYAGTKRWFSPEMTAACHLNVYKMSSKECVDGYGLAAVGIHLYESLCSSRGHVDPLCALSTKFTEEMTKFERNYPRNPLLAYDTLFYGRSQATESAVAQLETQAKHPQSSAGYKRAARLLRILSSFLIRDPHSLKRYSYVHSTPVSCTSWQSFRTQVRESKYV